MSTYDDYIPELRGFAQRLTWQKLLRQQEETFPEMMRFVDFWFNTMLGDATLDRKIARDLIFTYFRQSAELTQEFMIVLSYLGKAQEAIDSQDLLQSDMLYYACRMEGDSALEMLDTQPGGRHYLMKLLKHVLVTRGAWESVFETTPSHLGFMSDSIDRLHKILTDL
jgi:hypothetical protein